MPFPYPVRAQVPALHFQPEYAGSRRYLVDGEIREWGGKAAPVESGVMLRLAEGAAQETEGSEDCLEEQSGLRPAVASAWSWD